MHQLIDSHCHWDHPRLQNLQPDLWQSCLDQGVTQLIVPATQASHFQRQITLCQLNPHWHLALGLHPYFSHIHSSDHLQLLHQAIVAHKPVAVGEIGLDFSPDMSSKRCTQAEQEVWLLAQLDVAQEYRLPIIVHCRKANDRLAQLLRRHAFAEGGIVHAFSGSQQQAQAFTKQGFKIGFGGTLTYERAQAMQRLAIALPLADIVLETDAPDMPMAGSDRSLPNRPDYLPRVLQQLATLRPESVEQIAKQTYTNTQQVLRLD
ncbi:MAG: TatD family hydrolase [Oceanospirillaceae bacterium]|jgi:TatD DNase family protein|nr:TatD family hydrolase [Oceanospirillaceae bacterium]MBT4442162.1 TatD family hydrolase [Oceanospirillaceae bacterium]MBT6076863.1 TatD family hydrolase [Oceanospirillaceae bacterium]